MRSIALNPMDEYFACHDEYWVHLPLYYPRSLDVAAMSRALESVADSFWPLAAVLEQRDDGLHLVESADALLQLEEVDARDQAAQLDDPVWLGRLATPIAQAPGRRLTRLVVYQLAQGSLLSVNLGHVLCDGTSAFHFLAAWAAQCREGRLAPELGAPVLSRAALRPERGLDLDLRGADLERLVTESTGYTYTGDVAAARPRAVTWEEIRVRPEDLGAELSARAGRERAGLSVHDLVSAHVWKLSAAREPHGNPRLRLCGSVDVRRTDPRLRGYFGNAVAASMLELPRDEVLAAELPALAEQIRRAKGEVDFARVLGGLRLLRSMRDQLGYDSLRATSLIEPTRGLLVDDLTRVPTRLVDFGGGAPVLANPSAPIARIAMVYADERDLCLVRLSTAATAEKHTSL